jgi:hypothetical protein
MSEFEVNIALASVWASSDSTAVVANLSVESLTHVCAVRGGQMVKQPLGGTFVAAV